MSATRLALAAAVFVVSLAGCYSNPPYHPVDAGNPAPGQCTDRYHAFDAALTSHPAANQPHCGSLEKRDPDGDNLAECLARIVDAAPAGRKNPCWTAPSESHADYDLFFTEFDDQGWEADLRVDLQERQKVTNETEIDNLFDNLQTRVHQGNLDLVVYTHGWHGSPKSDNYYAVLFRAFLEELSKIDDNEVPKRHVVGVFVGWRGDSIKFPSKYMSVWDRKLAAETVSAGAVQGLFERLHRFYLDYSCHPNGDTSLSGNAESCGKVHMLTIGHSFGALIDFRSLLGNMETGLSTGPKERVYSFGDLVVLLNPAFEGTRYAPLYYSALHRAQFVAPDTLAGGPQLPAVVTLQSDGDWATGIAFPAFRYATTIADNPLGPERAQNDDAMGWVPAFRTHRLCLDPQAKSPNYKDGEHPQTALCKDVTLAASDGCDTPDGADSPTSDQLKCRLGKWAPQPTAGNAFSVLRSSPVYLGKGMSLIADPAQQPIRSPDFPYWVVKVDKAIMYDHDDIWNPWTTEVILELYHSVVAQSEAQVPSVKAHSAAQASPSKPARQ
jgi:hypothetical protein